MAAPTVQTRGVPLGRGLEKGFKNKFALGSLLTFSMWENSVTPGKWSGGAEIPQSTFFNTLYHTSAPQKLIKVGPFTIRGKFDPDVFKTAQIPTIINVPTAATLLLPDLGTLSMFGWPMDFDFSEMTVDGTTHPMLTMVFNVSNFDPVNRVEAGPSFVDGYTGTADA